MKSFSLYKTLLIVFFLGYSIISVYGYLFTKDKEIIPIFCWSLFSKVPNAPKVTMIEVEEDGKRVELFHSKHEYSNMKINIFMMVFKWYNSFVINGNKDALNTQKGFENSVNDGPFVYKMVQKQYEVLDKYRDNKSLSVKYLGAFKEGNFIDSLSPEYHTTIKIDSIGQLVNSKGISLNIIPEEDSNLRGFLHAGIRGSNFISLNGWAFDTKNQSLPDEIIIRYKNTIRRGVMGIDRKDVKKEFNLPLLETGYLGIIPVKEKEEVEPDEIKVYLLKDNNLYTIPKSNGFKL